MQKGNSAMTHLSNGTIVTVTDLTPTMATFRSAELPAARPGKTYARFTESSEAAVQYSVQRVGQPLGAMTGRGLATAAALRGPPTSGSELRPSPTVLRAGRMIPTKASLWLPRRAHRPRGVRRGKAAPAGTAGTRRRCSSVSPRRSAIRRMLAKSGRSNRGDMAPLYRRQAAWLATRPAVRVEHRECYTTHAENAGPTTIGACRPGGYINGKTSRRPGG